MAAAHGLHSPVPAGRIPQQPFLFSRQQWIAMHRWLRAIGVEHLNPQSGVNASAGAD